jgi:hypothetical protein
MVVLAVALSTIFVFFFMYLVLKLLQRLRRTWYQGESSSISDLEALNPQSLVVPPQYLSKMPLYRYPGGPEAASDTIESECSTLEGKRGGKQCSSNIQPASNAYYKTPETAVPDEMRPIYEELMPEIREGWAADGRDGPSFSQASCSICLEDFVPGSSLVRELPCTHIFHAECIDTFLSRESCLCPLCKMSVLPASFLPDQINNFIQRHEQKEIRLDRLHQFLRAGESSSTISSLTSTSTAEWLNSISAPQANSNAITVHELEEQGRTQPRTTEGQVSRSFEPQRRSQDIEIDNVDAHRRERIQQRAMQLLGPPVSNAEETRKTF